MSLIYIFNPFLEYIHDSGGSPVAVTFLPLFFQTFYCCSRCCLLFFGLFNYLMRFLLLLLNVLPQTKQKNKNCGTFAAVIVIYRLGCYVSVIENGHFVSTSSTSNAAGLPPPILCDYIRMSTHTWVWVGLVGFNVFKHWTFILSAQVTIMMMRKGRAICISYAGRGRNGFSSVLCLWFMIIIYKEYILLVFI